MTITPDNLTTPDPALTHGPADATAPTPGVTPITASTYDVMLDVLNDLVAHTHIFYDDYNTNCNCNCNCACSRGIL